MVIPVEHEGAAAWLREASLPVGDVDLPMWQAYIDRWKVNSRTGKPLAQSSLTRHLADVRQLWSWISATNELVDPWPLLNTRTRSSSGGRKGSIVQPVERSIVLSPAHVRELAAICGEYSFGPLAEVYILLLGIAGGRPGESAGVETEDLELVGHAPEVRFRRTGRRGIDASFLDPEDDAAWGPLKGRGAGDARHAPLPLRDAKRIRKLLRSEGIKGPLFAGWNRDKFARDVWDPARAEAVCRYEHRARAKVADDKDAEVLTATLKRLRLHDLRHAACSMWLNSPGIEVKLACEWSGHRRLSVFLDIYQGLMPGAKSSAAAKLNSTW
jgi:integrase